MEFVQGNQEINAKRKNKQIKAINSGNSFSRIFLIFEIIGDRWNDYQTERKELTLAEVKPGADAKENTEAKFRLFYITQGYMISIVAVDLVTNIMMVVLSLRVLWELLKAISSEVTINTVLNNGIAAWLYRATDIFVSFFKPVQDYLEIFLGNMKIGDFYFTNMELLSIVPPLLLILLIYIINKVLLRTIKTNVIELLT